ncbi:hypothetical protein D9613_008499 [Agrocybe pediades]|uniref:RNase III domain-containing protein n=1 Tax=Agrocybe pediades TaxID=84607 RepID=A0A8H4VN56_9AGAR|nr:hypothetical protein D9613_008499 [Agrocybe pediades]
MSRVARCISSPLRACSYSKSSLVARSAVLPGARAYGATAFQQRETAPHQEENRPRRPARDSRSANDFGRTRSGSSREAEQEEEYDSIPGRQIDASVEVPPHFSEYLERLFSPLKFPPELAQRILTHASHRDARRGHNAGLSFIGALSRFPEPKGCETEAEITGRRVLSSYLLMFLQSSPELTPQHDFEEILASTLHTNLLGEHVGHEWGVGQVLVWQPAASASKLNGERTELSVLRSAGLYKVQGEAIQAIMGAIYQQYGASVAHRVFHTRLLPLLKVKGGLPQAFYAHADRVLKTIGGENVPLLKQNNTKVEVESALSA